MYTHTHIYIYIYIYIYITNAHQCEMLALWHCATVLFCLFQFRVRLPCTKPRQRTVSHCVAVQDWTDVVCSVGMCGPENPTQDQTLLRKLQDFWQNRYSSRFCGHTIHMPQKSSRHFWMDQVLFPHRSIGCPAAGSLGMAWHLGANGSPSIQCLSGCQSRNQ